ncbi:hypothetical protein, partial [Enterobacter sp.]|uniref:hypothetical protein n=1 Tax=Enterobacter sp. TaxID=42895 RepID=UPI00296FCA2D
MQAKPNFAASLQEKRHKSVTLIFQRKRGWWYEKNNSGGDACRADHDYIALQAQDAPQGYQLQQVL